MFHLEMCFVPNPPGGMVIKIAAKFLTISVKQFNSLKAISVLAREKLILFDRYVQNFYVGIVQ